MSGICKPLFNTPLNRAHWAAQGLVASYLFNENSGRTVYDSSGNGNHGTMIGFGAEDTATSGWCAGPHGGALAFDGSNDYISVPMKYNWNLPFTIIINVSLSTLTMGGLIGNRRNSSPYWLMGSYQNVIQFERSGPLYAKSTYVLYGNGYQSLAATVKSNDINIYHNNDIIASDTRMLSNIVNDENILEIGRWYGGGIYWYGFINYIHIYSYALSPEEITYLSCVDPYAAYRWDNMVYPNTVPAKMNHYRRCVA